MLVLRHPMLQIMHRYCSEDFEPPSLRFERNAHGKPQISWEEADGQPDPPIHFSLTHTSSLLGKITALPASHSVHIDHWLYILTQAQSIIHFSWKQSSCSFMQQSVDQPLNKS